MAIRGMIGLVVCITHILAKLDFESLSAEISMIIQAGFLVRNTPSVGLLA